MYTVNYGICDIELDVAELGIIPVCCFLTESPQMRIASWSNMLTYHVI